MCLQWPGIHFEFKPLFRYFGQDHYHPVSVFFQVGGIKPGCFKIGNTGGMLDNILASRLYRPGRLAVVLLFGFSAYCNYCGDLYLSRILG